MRVDLPGVTAAESGPKSGRWTNPWQRVGRLLLALAGSLTAGASLADTRVELLATEPAAIERPGEALVLGLNQNFYMRIAYSADEPVRIWARPFFRGSEVAAGSHPSRIYSGEGELMAWFFFIGEPGQQVDEIRVSAGDGSTDGNELIANWPLRITGGAALAAEAREPEWLTRLKADDERRAREDYETRMSTPPGAGDALIFGGFMLAVLVLGIAGIAAPVWALRRWQGGWRFAAAVPAGILLFVVLRIMLDTARDPTSHNLWPFEILQASVMGLAIIGALALARKITGG